MVVAVKVTVIGGGPGGLYAGLLLKKTYPDWTVTVYERNPPEVTYGWGIVFPNRALSNLEDADPASHRTITDSFNRWENFEIWYDGTRYACGGHTFASMMRTDLLRILQDRARSVGVDLRFDHEIEDPATYTETADLVIGADGIHSRVRATWAEAFGVEKLAGTTHFSWFGTDADFDALSHIFETNEAGIFCAHTYPGRTSTFIVDCDRETWKNAELAAMDEPAYLAYLEEVFADHLDGRSIKSEIDKWRTFTTIRNDTWRHDNVVLLGDAAHTAHYSIGSGTTMAMEDAIGLKSAFERAGPDIDAALQAYERDRRPFVEELQLAGERSREHFEAIRRFYDLPERQRAIHHLTRSGRLSYGSLERRDPGFIADFDRWFAGQVGDDDPDTVGSADPPLAQPYALGRLDLDTRLVAAVEPSFSSHDGIPSIAQRRALESRATSGVALVLTPPLAVTPRGRSTPASPGLYEDQHAAALRPHVEAIDEIGVAAGAHLTHAGPRAGGTPRGLTLERPTGNAWSPLAASALAFGDRRGPERLATSDIPTVTQAFVDAADRAAAAGFDYLQLHMGHGNLLASFLSPLTNRRTDRYGGSLANRLRFPLEVLRAVDDAWQGPLGVTMPGTDWVADGLSMTDVFETADALAEAGADIVAPVCGGTVPDETPDPLRDPRRYSNEIRNEVGVATMATGHATSTDEANTLVGTGRADLVLYYGPPPANDPRETV